jgi:hypothetical protein
MANPAPSPYEKLAWYQKWGNGSQVAAAVFALGTLIAAIVGIKKAEPFFQNQLLTEKNARLEIEKERLESESTKL